MVALITLSEDELTLVEQGFFDEPGFRPHPRARQSIEEDEASYEAKVIHASLIERTLRAHWWHRSTTERVLMFRREQDAGRTLVAFGSAAGGKRGRASGTRIVYIGPWKTVDPIPATEIRAELPPRSRTKFDELIATYSRPLPPVLAHEIDAVLETRVPGYPLIASDQRPLLRQRPTVTLTRRDRSGTALSVLTPRWRSLVPVDDPDPSPLARSVERTVRRVSENSLITDDTAVFEDWQRGARSRDGWWEFRHAGRRMFIKNVNADREERDTGADLIYVRTNPAAVVLVQYKLATYTADGQPHLPIDDRLESQLDRLTRHESVAAPNVPVDEFRLGPGFSFVKVLGAPPSRPLEESELTAGWYLPSAFVQGLIASGATGPRGGRSIPIDPERAILPTVFTGLVRSAWIGTAGSVSARLAALVDPKSADVTFAVDEPLVK